MAPHWLKQHPSLAADRAIELGRWQRQDWWAVSEALTVRVMEAERSGGGLVIHVSSVKDKT